VHHFDGAATAKDGQPDRNSYAWFLHMRDGQIIRAEASFDSIASNYLWQRVHPAMTPRSTRSPSIRRGSTTLHGGVGALLAEQANGRHVAKRQSPVSAARGVPYFRLEPSVRPLRRNDTNLRQKLDDIA
jgi:hypothetical protein